MPTNGPAPTSGALTTSTWRTPGMALIASTLALTNLPP